MKTISIAAVFAAATAFTANAASVTYEFDVADGQTDTVTNMIERLGYSAITHGDTIKKMGLGQLSLLDNSFPYRANLQIEQGVYYVDGTGYVQHCSSRWISIKSGATLNISGRKSHLFDGRALPIYFIGDGTGNGNNLGAICIGGDVGDSTFDPRPQFIMNGDATIYCYGTMNALFSGSGGNPSTLNMNGHTLTIRGKDENSVFRPRHDWTVTNAGPIIVRSGQFARHLAPTTVLPHNIPLVSFRDGARMAAYSDGATSPWNYVDAFEFEAGTQIFKGNGSPTTATMTMKKVTGPVTISAAEVTISEELVVRGSDLAAGNALSSSKALSFGEGCILSVDGFGGISLAAGTVHTVASSSVSITGTPVLSENAARFFTLANTGTALTLTVKSGVIDVVNDWGVQAGAANAAANTAAVASHVGSVGDGAVLYVPAGEYWFTDTFDLSSVTASGVMVWNPERNAVIHSGLAVGAATDMTVEGIVFDGCAGPAVVANGTAGLTVTNCGIANVVGAYAGGHYPFAAVNVTDFNVCGSEWTNDSASLDGQGYLSGGTQVATSEVYSNSVVVAVSAVEGEVDWTTATNRLGLSASAYAGKILRKVGPGTFAPNQGAAATNGINGVEIVEGSFVADSNESLGVAGGYVRIHDGANLTVVEAPRGLVRIKERTIYMSGTGLSAEYPAVRFDYNWIEPGITWVLEGDAAMYVNTVASSSYNTFFNECFMKANGHTLTLSGVAGSHFRFRYSMGWYGGGTLIADGLPITSSEGIGSTKGFRVIEGEAPLFVFRNGAKLRPGIDKFCGLVTNCWFDAGTELSPLSASMNLSFKDFGGAPAVGANAASISIGGVLSLKAADVLAGRYATAQGSLSFGANATWKIDDPTALARGDYTVFTAAGGITGKPKADPSMGDADWRAYHSDAHTLRIGPKSGLRVIFR